MAKHKHTAAHVAARFQARDCDEGFERKRQAAAPKWDPRKVRSWMAKHVKDYEDKKTGEANSTALAEAAADEFDIYEDRRDYNIPEELFDLAVEVAERAGM